jgi:microcystin-dependent protein
MAFTTPNLALNVWNLTTDPYDHEELAENWAKVDEHDHSTGKGKQIPTGGIEDAAITADKIAPSAIPSLTVDDGSIGPAKLAENSVTNEKILDGAVTLSKLAGGLALPTGAVVPYGGTGAPSGWLVCDGAEYATGDYPTLYGVIGTAYGSGSGTFKVPDIRGRIPVGVGIHSDVSARGKEENPTVAVGSRTPDHLHGAGTLSLDTGTDVEAYSTSGVAATLIGDTANGAPPFVTLNFIIRY